MGIVALAFLAAKVAPGPVVTMSRLFVGTSEGLSTFSSVSQYFENNVRFRTVSGQVSQGSITVLDPNDPVPISAPNSFALARTVEYFRIPRRVLTICLGKSTYARCGIIVNVTPLEPEWEGHVTLEFSNTTPLPAKIYANEGVAQFLFLESDEECETSYKDRGGKYQGQRGVTLPKT